MSLIKRRFDESKSGSYFLINPFLVVGFVACIGVLGLLGLPEPVAAIIILIAVIGVSLLHPLNGVATIILYIPFFLEGGNRQYFFLLDIFVLATLLSAALWSSKNALETRLPIKRILLLFILVSIAAFPLDGKEFYYELWARSYSDLFEIWVIGYIGSAAYYFRVVFNTLTGVGLFMVVAYFWESNNRDYAKNLINAFILMAVIISLVGTAFYYQIIPTGERFLSASLVGRQGGITAFAYNKAILVQYLSFALCFCLVMARENIGIFKKALFYYFPTVLFVFVMFMSRQRIAIVIVTIPFFVYGAIALFRHKKIVKTGLVAAALVVSIAGIVTLDSLYLGGVFAERFSLIGSDPRVDLWRTAANMLFSNPLLGVGTGRFNSFFSEYFNPELASGKLLATSSIYHVAGNAHSFYMQTAAEKGAAGLLVTLTLVGAVLTIAWRKYRSGWEGAYPSLYFGSLACLLMWLLLGGVYYIAHVRSFELFFWIIVGFLLAEEGKKEKPFDLSRRAALVMAGIIVLAGAFQVWSLSVRPLTEGRSVGVYSPERLPSGGLARWTMKRAVMFEKIDAPLLKYRLSTPIPGIDARPQEVTIRVSGMEKKLSVNDTKWHDVTFDVAKIKSQTVAVMIETAYTYNPAKETDAKDSRDLGVYVERVRQ